MTTIPVIQTTDVAALKCIYFQLVKTLKEIRWYGLDCNLELEINKIEQAFSYLSIINSACTLTHQLQCEIKSFITRNISHCIFVDTSCNSNTVTIQQSYLLTEDGDPITTESGEIILI